MDFDPAQQAEDLKAFEGRLVEIVNNLGPTAVKWKCILVLCISCCLLSAYAFVVDIHTAKFGTITELFLNHKFFTMCCIILILLFATGVQQRIMAQAIITNRYRNILKDLNMSCDNLGKLILRPNSS